MSNRSVEDNFSDYMLNVESRCPICGHDVGNVKYHAKDWMFGSSNRVWDYCTCHKCDSLVLMRRPEMRYISIAYNNYYTHSDRSGSGEIRHGYVSKLSRRYLSSAIGYSVKDKLFHIAASVILPLRIFLDAKTRHISYLKPGRLLDFGCGNGEFMNLAGRFGWEVRGYDLDDKAVSCAHGFDLDVSVGGIEALEAEISESYDLITLSHVVEHMYEPRKLLADCARLLKSDGVLWIETPNSLSAGLSLYGKYWRGLEAPRHLVLSNYNALAELLSELGFTSVTNRRHTMSGFFMSVESEKNRFLDSAFSVTKRLPVLYLLRGVIFGFLIEVIQSIFLKRGEFVTVTAKKPTAYSHVNSGENINT